MFALSLVEVITIVSIIVIERKIKVYLSLTMFCRDVMYHFMFIALNFVLYLDYLFPYDGTEIQKQVRGIIL